MLVYCLEVLYLITVEGDISALVPSVVVRRSPIRNNKEHFSNTIASNFPNSLWWTEGGIKTLTNTGNFCRFLAMCAEMIE
jgi:hypothetical protein